MKKQFKKLLCAALSLTMIAGSIVLPTAALADGETTDLKSWKFDFGASATDNVETGYIGITPDTDYYAVDSQGYGFLGIDENGYKLGGRLDGFEQQEGQVIDLEAGGSTDTNVLNDAIGSVGADDYDNAGDKYYPVRFAVKADDETYYKIKATVTTLDPTKDATASLYTERKHPLYTEKTIAAGETVTTEFTIRVTPIYYQKSDPQGAIADGMINVCVLGENSALAALEIEQVETAPTLWVLGDSTVTDGWGTLPFFPLQNYTGVGTGLTKYLPSNIAMVNEGEGGLTATDSLHFNMVSSRIKAGDYLYVEYGHNHKNNQSQSYTNEYWWNDYVKSLPKYYEACEAVGATLIIVGPIDRHNDVQYDSATNTWSSTLDSFSNLGKQYIDALKYGGTVAANAFVAKWAEIATYAEANKTGSAVTDETAKAYVDELKAAADKIVTDAVEGGTVALEKVAFVDLNHPSLEWLATISASAVVKDQEVTNSKALTDYYFQTTKGGGTDGTHPNDTGAENLAYLFFTTADDEEYPALTPLLANFKDGAQHEEPTPVSADIINMGEAGKSDAWPTYNPPVDLEYPIVIKDIALDETNQFTTLTAYVQASFSNYAAGVLEILDENGDVANTYVTITHVDNTTGKGTNILTFADGIYLLEGQTYRAYMWSLDMATGELMSEDEGGEQLSGIYTPTEIDTYILPGENGDVEDFNHYSQTTLTGSGKYIYGGSAASDLELGVDGNGVTYTKVASDGAKNGAANQGSFYIMRPLENLVDEDGNAIGTGDTGRYMIDVDIMYTSGGGLNFAFCENTTPTKSPFVSNQFTAFGIGNGGAVTVNGTEVGTVSGTSWTNVKYILDMNAGTAEISVAGGTPVTVDAPTYKTFGTPSIATLKHFILEGQKVAFDVKLSNLTVAKLKDTDATAALNVGIEDIEQPTIYEVTANADADYSDAQLIIATYDENNTLDTLTIEDKALSQGENKFEIEAEEGIKIMLWDGLDTMKPIDVTSQLKEQEPIIPGTVYINTEGTTEATVAQGGTVTACAVPNDGYVFVKWIGVDGKAFSNEAELDVRLYTDLSLIAQFAVQGGVDDITSYKVTADKSLVKAGTEQTITLTLEDVFDADGNPVKYSDSDASWSCDDEAITVTGGVVTIPASYTIDSNTKDITVTCTLNNIQKKVTITLYSYEFFEDVSGGETTAAWDGNITTIASRNCIVFPGGGNTATLTLPNPVSIGNGRTVSYKAVWSGSNTCGQPRYIEIYDSNGNKVINEVMGYSWTTFTVGGTVGGSSIDNGTNFADAITKDTWGSDVVITINSDGTGTVTLGSTSADITINSAATDIAAIKFISTTGAPDYTQRALGVTDITIK